jgi:hypothetical protein
MKILDIFQEKLSKEFIHKNFPTFCIFGHISEEDHSNTMEQYLNQLSDGALPKSL